MNRTFFFVFALCFTMLASFGCGGAGSTEGTFKIFLSDAPAPGVTSVMITIDKIEAHLDGNWVEVASTPQTIDLLSLVQDATIVATAGVAPGDYTQVRLFVSSATVTDADGDHSVIIPSNLNTGIKVNIDATVFAGGVTAILLDFNVDKSFVQQGNGTYLLQPVIPGVLVELSGTITGTVSLAGNPVEGALVTATYTAGTNYPIGTEVNTSTTAADGSFKVWALKEGTYTLTATFTDSVPADYSGTVAGVNVVRVTNTDVGDIALVLVP